MTASWTTTGDIRATLRARWDRGTYLRRYASDAPWEQLSFPVRGPSADDVLRDPSSVQRWVGGFASVAPFVVEYRTLRSRTLGRNEIPARLRLETFDDLVGALDVADSVLAFDAMMNAAQQREPALVAWVVEHPIRAVHHAADWERLLGVIEWIEANAGPRFVRHIDIPGVDTKFVESNEKILRQLLPLVLPTERVALDERSFARRFGFLDKPLFTRMRFLDTSGVFPDAITELQLRTEELALVELPVSTVFVVENEVTYLAFPQVADAIVIFGGGFAVTTLEQVSWLTQRRIVYWGDIDTHGFVILDRLRQRFPHTESMLMDHETLCAHLAHASVETAPIASELVHLSAPEREVFDALVTGRHGSNVRLEQERVRFSLVRERLKHFSQ